MPPLRIDYLNNSVKEARKYIKSLSLNKNGKR